MKEWNDGEKLQNPEWFDGRNVNEPRLMEYLQKKFGLMYVRGTFYDRYEHSLSDEEVQKELVRLLEPVTQQNLNRKSRDLLNLAKIKCLWSDPPELEDYIHLKNGTYDTMTSQFSSVRHFTTARLPVVYDEQAEPPELFLSYLNQLLEPEDILTLQEYLGYCLLPTTKGQKMLILMGDGGEGKSVLGQVIGLIWGSSAVFNSIQKISTDRFARADLENRLLMVDDDMSMESLAKTHYFKTLITLSGKTDVEKKGVQSYQTRLYCRFIGFSNSSLSALYDRSFGFYRRLLLLRTRPKPADREDDPYLIDRLAYEKDAIAKWCIDGLERLMGNRWHFTVSQAAVNNLKTAMLESDPIPEFLASDGYLTYSPKSSIASSELYEVFKRFCLDNSLFILSNDAFQKRVKPLLLGKGARYTTHVPCRPGKSIRGYVGLQSALVNLF